MLYALGLVCLTSMCNVPDGFGDLIFTAKDRCEVVADALNKDHAFPDLAFACSEVDMFHASRAAPVIPTKP